MGCWSGSIVHSARGGVRWSRGERLGRAGHLATAAAARTAHASGSLVAGYRLYFLIATALALLAGVLVAWQLSSRDCQQELTRQQTGSGAPPTTPAEAQLRKC